MKNHKGFALIDVLVLVAVIGIIAAIAIPCLLRTRISANEAAAVGDTRTLISANAAYASGNGGGTAYASSLGCLFDPPNCSAGMWPVGTTSFINIDIAAAGGLGKQGYGRAYFPGAFSTGTFDPGVMTFSYQADPETPGQTGARYFCGDHGGTVCADSAQVACTGAGLPALCPAI